MSEEIHVYVHIVPHLNTENSARYIRERRRAERYEVLEALKKDTMEYINAIGGLGVASVAGLAAVMDVHPDVARSRIKRCGLHTKSGIIHGRNSGDSGDSDE